MKIQLFPNFAECYPCLVWFCPSETSGCSLESHSSFYSEQWKGKLFPTRHSNSLGSTRRGQQGSIFSHYSVSVTHGHPGKLSERCPLVPQRKPSCSDPGPYPSLSPLFTFLLSFLQPQPLFFYLLDISYQDWNMYYIHLS